MNGLPFPSAPSSVGLLCVSGEGALRWGEHSPPPLRTTSEAVLYAKELDRGSLMYSPESAIQPVISELSFMGCFIIGSAS